MFPENLMEATFRQTQTTYETVTVPNVTRNSEGHITSQGPDIMKRIPKTEMKDGINVLGLIVFCIAFGITISGMGERARMMVEFFAVLDECIMRIVRIVMWYSPIGIMCLITGKILQIDNLTETARQLGLYMVTVICGLVIHACITLPRKSSLAIRL